MYFTLTNELKELNESFRGVNIKPISLIGSTIKGFGKRESTLNSRSSFDNEVESFKPDFICFALGQVDIELGIYYKEIIKDEKFDKDDYINELVNSYLTSIEDIQSKFNLSNNAICIKGINISVLTNSREKAIDYTNRIINENINNEEDKKSFRAKLREKYPSNIERYKNHILFNELIKNKIRDKYSYFDINDIIEDKKNPGTCKLQFIPSKKDHHILDSLFIREKSIMRLIKCCIKL